MDRVGARLGMYYALIAVIALSTIINVLAIWFFCKSMLSGLLSHLIKLDSTIAEAISSVIGENSVLAQEVNPVQLMIMDLIKNNMTQKVPDLDKLRDNSGKFT